MKGSCFDSSFIQSIIILPHTYQYFFERLGMTPNCLPSEKANDISLRNNGSESKSTQRSIPNFKILA